MTKKTRGAALTVIIILLQVSHLFAQRSSSYLKGYKNDVKGEILSYHSPIPEASSSLLVRSLDEKLFIEWETEAIPDNWPHQSATFVWLGGMDVNADAHSFKIYINGKHHFTLKNPRNNKNPDWVMESAEGVVLTYKNALIDRHNDQMGFYFLTVPVNLFPTGEALCIKIQGESSDSRSWYMTFRYGLEQTVELTGEPAVVREGDGQYQWLRLDIIHLHETGRADVFIAGEEISRDLQLGLNRIRVKVPRVTEERNFPIEVMIDGQLVANQNYLFKPVKEKVIYLIHHSHNDIGYTHVQTEVEQAQWSYLEQCIELARESQNNPEGSQFKWNVEVMWAVESYLENAPQEKKNAFIEAVQNGWIELDGLYGNELTGLCRPEELMYLMEASRKVGKLCGVPVVSAMISDVPGYTWGLVPAMAHYGIKYFSIGTNSFHRIGNIIESWGDKPFYWESPSGKDSVLCWLHKKGYSFFHTGLGYSKLDNKLKPEAVFNYIEELEAEGYPYDLIPFRYNIGSDNGPPDPNLAETVKNWNEQYVTPQLKISTVSEVFGEFETLHGEEIPVVRGDLTPYWEDGAASSALETAINRETAEKLVQAEILWTLYPNEMYAFEEFYEAWRNVLLYDEHTWGSWNSISEPEADFTKQQWNIKQSFALDARELTDDILDFALSYTPLKDKKPLYIDVYNTSSWERSDLVLLPDGIRFEGKHITDDQGKVIPSQFLTTGELAFVAENIPPLGTKRFYLKRGKKKRETTLVIENNRISNGTIDVILDPRRGVIKTLKSSHIPLNFAGKNGDSGLNEYYYVKGRDPEVRYKSGNGTLHIKENGPVMVSLEFTSDAPGCYHLSREIRLINGIDRVDIMNTVNKKRMYDPEGVHFGFPFNITDGEVTIDIAWGTYQPDRNQLPGSCKNYFTVQRWVDISNRDYGITWVTPDAPLIELGKITADPIAYGWVKEVGNTQTLYSYVMNNYWETNYKASQDGEVVFRYTIFPHQSFNPAEAEKRGIEICQPLYGKARVDEKQHDKPFIKVNSPGVIITSVRRSEDNKANMVRLYNPGKNPVMLDVDWGRWSLRRYISSPLQEEGEELPENYQMAPYEILTLRID